MKQVFHLGHLLNTKTINYNIIYIYIYIYIVLSIFSLSRLFSTRFNPKVRFLRIFPSESAVRNDRERGREI